MNKEKVNIISIPSGSGESELSVKSDKLIIHQSEFLLENLVMIVFMCQN